MYIAHYPQIILLQYIIHVEMQDNLENNNRTNYNIITVK